MKVTQKLDRLGYELVPHIAGSPDLSPSDFYLSSNVKGWLSMKKFHSIEEIESRIDEYLDEFEELFYSRGVEILEERWTKCIDHEGDYVEELE